MILAVCYQLKQNLMMCDAMTMFFESHLKESSKQLEHALHMVFGLFVLNRVYSIIECESVLNRV